MQKLWTDRGWDDYVYWQNQDKKLVKKINALLKDIERTPFAGLGKPEPLKNDADLLCKSEAGWWSRRIDDVNRIVYRVEKGNLEIAQCRKHTEPGGGACPPPSYRKAVCAYTVC